MKNRSKEAGNNLTRFPLGASFQGTNRLFVLAFNNTTEKFHRKYFLPRVDITN